MNSEANEALKTCLDGELSMRTVAEKYPALANFYTRLVSADASGEQQDISRCGAGEIDLTGITDIDACGCQLLVLFLRSLEENHLAAQLTNVPGAIRTKIHFLGFDSKFKLSH